MAGMLRSCPGFRGGRPSCVQTPGWPRQEETPQPWEGPLVAPAVQDCLLPGCLVEPPETQTEGARGTTPPVLTARLVEPAMSPFCQTPSDGRQKPGLSSTLPHGCGGRNLISTHLSRCFAFSLKSGQEICSSDLC